MMIQPVGFFSNRVGQTLARGIKVVSNKGRMQTFRLEPLC